MVEVTPYKSVTLGGFIKEAQAKGKNPAAYLQEKASVAENKMGDLVDLSPEARQKIEKGRKVNSYLSMFGAFLKLLNSPLSRSYVPDLENPARNKVQKDA